MTYGIDLGTTKSYIGLFHEDGSTDISKRVPSIIEDISTTGKDYPDVGSNVDPSTPSHRNYKINIGISEQNELSVHCSTFALRELKKVYGLRPEEDIEAVIAVPAYFSTAQCEATVLAASSANIDAYRTVVVNDEEVYTPRIIREPVAAALYLSRGKPGKYIIFDLGGGTLDISVIELDTERVLIRATAGLPLGGSNLDTKLSNFLCRKYMIQKEQASKPVFQSWIPVVKEKRSNSDKMVETFELPDGIVPVETTPDADGKYRIQFTLTEYMHLVESAYSAAVTTGKSVFSRIPFSPKDAKFIFVGGATECRYLRNWVCDNLQVTEDNTIEYDRNDAVAKGVAYYAYLCDKGTDLNIVVPMSKMLNAQLDNNKILVPLVHGGCSIPVTNVYTALDLGKAGKHTIRLVYGDVSVCLTNNLSQYPEYAGEFEVTSDVDNQQLIVSSSIGADGVIVVEYHFAQCPVQKFQTFKKVIL